MGMVYLKTSLFHMAIKPIVHVLNQRTIFDFGRLYIYNKKIFAQVKKLQSIVLLVMRQKNLLYRPYYSTHILNSLH
jgi:hypothetical protein